MYFFYVDASGNLDPQSQGKRTDGTVFEKDWIYVLTAVSLFDGKWRRFEGILNKRKMDLMARIHRETDIKIDLADAEIKSTWVRIPKERAKRPFLANLSAEELTGLVSTFYDQIPTLKMHLFSVIIDKRMLFSYMDQEKLHRKAYELLLERIESFLHNWHDRQLGLIVADNTSREMNRSIAMKHAFFQREGTSSGLRLRHIAELPMFVESYLSNGVQLADLCGYDVYRAFKTENPAYPYFAKLVPAFYTSPLTPQEKIDGLKVFPDNSPLVKLVSQLETERKKPTPQMEMGLVTPDQETKEKM